MHSRLPLLLRKPAYHEGRLERKPPPQLAGPVRRCDLCYNVCTGMALGRIEEFGALNKAEGPRGNLSPYHAIRWASIFGGDEHTHPRGSDGALILCGGRRDLAVEVRYEGTCPYRGSAHEQKHPCGNAVRVSILPGSTLVQSRNATDAIALDRFSVFISTRCQTSSRMVAWSGCQILPRT
jgi:hypothetical protein